MARTTPFEQVHLQLGAEFSDYSGWRLPSRFGGSESEKDALDNHCAAFDLCGFGRLSLKGSDCKTLLGKMGYDLPGELGSCKWIWANGTSGSVSRVAAMNSDYILLSRPGDCEAVYDQVKEIVFDLNLDVKVLDLQEKTAYLGLYGPKTYDSFIHLLPFDVDKLEKGEAMPVSFFLMNMTLMRGSWTNGDGMELICPVSAANLVGGSIAKYRQKYNITPGGMECLLTAMEANR